MERARNKRSNNQKKKEGQRSSSNSSRAAVARKKQKAATTRTDTADAAAASAVVVRVDATAAAAANKNNNNDDDSFFSNLVPDTLYHITTFLDEVELYCLEEAFPKEVKKFNVSHKRWKKMLEIQNEEYSLDDPRRGLERMINENHPSPDILGRVIERIVPRWPPQDGMGRTTAIMRGRYFAQEVLYAKETLQSKSEFSMDHLSPDEASKCAECGIEGLTFDYRLSRQDLGSDIFVTAVHREGHYVATSMPRHNGMEWSSARRRFPDLTMYRDYDNKLDPSWWHTVSFGISRGFDIYHKDEEDLLRLYDDKMVRRHFKLVRKYTSIWINYRRKRFEGEC